MVIFNDRSRPNVAFFRRRIYDDEFMREKGRLFVIEGIDGAGKSTQVRLLLRKLRARGIDAVSFREPTRGRWGREIRVKAKQAGSLTPERELELFLRDRQENVAKRIRPALERGRVILMDRYYFSTVAYQGAKGLDPARIRRLKRAVCSQTRSGVHLGPSGRPGIGPHRGTKEPRPPVRAGGVSAPGPADLRRLSGKAFRPP